MNWQPPQAVVLALFLAFVCGPAAGARGDDWPQWMGPQRDGVWRETGILEVFPAAGPAVRWRTPIGGGYAGPCVAAGKVFVTDRTPAGERVLCLDEADGKVLWKHEYPCRYTISYPAGPRTTPAVADGKLYTLGAEGDFLCLDAETGRVVWSHRLKQEYGIPKSPTWGFASNPLVDGDRVICFAGGDNSTVLAFDKETGREVWRALDWPPSGHGPGYSSPVVVEAGGRRQLIAWHTRAVSALDPETGEVLWEKPFSMQSGLSLATPRQLGDHLFVSGFYNGSLMLRLDPTRPAAEVLWQRRGTSERKTDALHCLIGTPYLEDGYVYGVDSYGELRCLEMKSGERVWETMRATGARGPGRDRWATAFLVKHEDRFFIFNEQGELIIARLTPAGYDERSRTRLLEPTNRAQQRAVLWSHPAFANRSVYVRNDREVVCFSLAAEERR